MSRTRGFTLIELLVVLGIIALLIGQVMPALVGGRAPGAWPGNPARGRLAALPPQQEPRRLTAVDVRLDAGSIEILNSFFYPHVTAGDGGGGASAGSFDDHE